MAFETEAWPYVPAKHIGPKRSGPVRLIVIHTAEWPEVPMSAQALARYFEHPDYVSSPHVCVSNLAVVQCVKDSFVAYAAPGANHDGIQMELAGYAGQSAAEWRDAFSLGLLAMAADATAQYCLKYDIPPVHLTDGLLAGGAKGIIGHDQASRVYKKSDHTDPGPNFPWPRFIAMVKELRAERRLVA